MGGFEFGFALVVTSEIKTGSSGEMKLSRISSLSPMTLKVSITAISCSLREEATDINSGAS